MAGIVGGVGNKVKFVGSLGWATRDELAEVVSGWRCELDRMSTTQGSSVSNPHYLVVGTGGHLEIGSLTCTIASETIPEVVLSQAPGVWREVTWEVSRHR